MITRMSYALSPGRGYVARKRGGVWEPGPGASPLFGLIYAPSKLKMLNFWVLPQCKKLKKAATEAMGITVNM